MDLFRMPTMSFMTFLMAIINADLIYIVKCGSFDVWREMQIKCCEHVIPRIVIAAGYASLLLEKFGLNPFGVHLWGDTGKGKSVAILASASIYGYPSITDGIVYTGNATSNGLEPRLSFVRKLLLLS